MGMGYIRRPEDVKCLILYSLSLLPIAIAEEDLLEIVLIDDGFGYFEFAQCFHELIDSGLISEIDVKDHKEYVLSLEGRRIAELTDVQLRLSVRDRAQAAALRVVRRIRRDKSIRAGHVKNEDGTFRVTLAVYDRSFEILSISVTAYNERQCQLLEENFKRGAETISMSVLNMLLDEGGKKPEEEI